MIQASYDSVIVRKIGAILVPFVQLFALYVLFFGQYGPGGGFVAGVMIGASLIVDLLVFGREGPAPTAAERALAGDGVGLIVFALVGGLCLIGGGEFLNYADIPVPGIDDASRRFLGILLTQVGVAVDVAVAAVSIVFSLWRDDERGASDA